MDLRSNTKRQNVVSQTGAQTGSILVGTTENNRGLRLRILQDQPRNVGGPILGSFDILHEGDNKHSQSLRTLLHQTTNAEKVLQTIRQEHPQCVNVVNASILIVEKEDLPPAHALPRKL